MKGILVTMMLGLTCFGLVSCAGSRVHTTDFELASEKGKIAVLPWIRAKKSLSASDARQRQEMAFGLIGMIAGPMEAVDEASGLFTYTFEKSDYANLRQSVIQSLQKSDAFPEVIDVSDTPPQDEDIRLILTFSESGIKKTPVSFKCILKGAAQVARSATDTWQTRNIAIEATSVLSVSGAKNKAIKLYLDEIGELLKCL